MHIGVIDDNSLDQNRDSKTFNFVTSQLSDYLITSCPYFLIDHCGAVGA